ncbi:hypothetical protein [Lacticaseibacillus porcinae]|uniref:hypothetical protein n=1 Tax=Lacticaseibacillus porcinae TaxID=1123687 RepID=UPI000F7868C5|nr:hypothetical protein [Lacticaseibacillus porcinae]
MDATLVTATEVGIIAAVVAAGTQLVKQIKLPNEYLPLVAAVIGIIAGLVATAVTHDTNYLAGATQGLITAAGTSWVVDASKPATKAVADRLAASKQAQNDANKAAITASVKAEMEKQAKEMEDTNAQA